MTTRVLPPDEWHRLKGTEAETVWPTLDPSTTQALVVERDGVIVGSWLLMTVLHVECLWIAPEYRGSASVGRKLIVGMWALVRSLGGRGVMTGAMSDQVRALIAKVGGTKVPGDQFVISLQERT